MVGPVVTSLIIIIGSVVLGAGVIFFGGSLFQTNDDVAGPNQMANKSLSIAATRMSMENATKAYEALGIPSEHAENLAKGAQYINPILYNNTETGHLCSFTRSYPPFTYGPNDVIRCDDKPHVAVSRFNDTITLQYAEVYSHEAFPLIETFNQEGYEVKSLVIVDPEGTIWNGSPSRIFLVVLQK